MEIYDATAGKMNSITSEKATKWIKMKQCVGIRSSEMTTNYKAKTYERRANLPTSESKYCRTHAQ